MQRRVQRRLVKAHKMFQKRHQRHQEKLKEEQEKMQKKNASTPEKEEQEALCSPRSLCYSPCDSFCGGEYDVLDEPSQKDHSHSDSSTTSTSDDEETVETFMAMENLSQDLSMHFNGSLQERKKRRRTFSTKPTTKMVSNVDFVAVYTNICCSVY